MQSVEQVGRKTIAGKSIRWDEKQAEAAYGKGYWVKETLADTLLQAATQEPERILIIDGAVRLDARTLHQQSHALALVMADRYPVGSVISFMLPNWHEAAVIYMAATMAGMIAHPVLPSLREHDLCFMLQDLQCRMIFIPEQFR
ncbi:MAG: AMP-binding protein, partial [Ketobacter sp.]